MAANDLRIKRYESVPIVHGLLFYLLSCPLLVHQVALGPAGLMPKISHYSS